MRIGHNINGAKWLYCYISDHVHTTHLSR